MLTVEKDLAVVRVLEEDRSGSLNFTDVLLMLKIDDQWKCVAKAYNQNLNTIKKYQQAGANTPTAIERRLELYDKEFWRKTLLVPNANLYDRHL
mgnify:CR=1 FL=1